MADERPTLSTSRLDATEITRRSFGTVRRGFDPEEVRAYLGTLADALGRAARREEELLGELEDAREQARHPVIDESVLTSSLGQRSAAVLRGAHEEAARILSQAEESAASMIREAQQQATDMQVNAESSAAKRIAEAELEANSLRQQAHEEAAAVVETARLEGEAVVERAREHGRSMLDQAQEARRRVLADMAQRRRLITEQIELLRAARDEIAGSVVGVRRALDRIVEDLSRADDSARAAASGAAASGAGTPGAGVPESVLVEEGERAASAVAAPEHEPRPVLRFDDVATIVERPAPVTVADVADADVADLFARLRARHAAAGVGEQPEGAAGAGGDLEARGGPWDSEEAAGAEDAEDAEVAEVAAASLDAGLFTRRAEVLDPISTTLSRRLKRALQDDQNALLDRLRQGTGEWTGDLLVDEVLQREVYVKAATTSVREAMAEGSAFARTILGARRPKAPATVDERAVGSVAEELASTVVTLIRRRLEGGDIPDAAERVGAAYREWRGERIERLAEDYAVEGFSRGVLAGSGKHSVRWSRSDAGPGCADCEDNGLAGAVAPGDQFPTGHRHPPAHAGCRCLVLPTPS